jgi:hypothetical protein
MHQDRKYEIVPQIVTGQKQVETNCNAITFINLGTDPVLVLGATLQTGQQLPIPGNYGEMCVSNILVEFAGTTTDKRCLVLTKFYLQEK